MRKNTKFINKLLLLALSLGSASVLFGCSSNSQTTNTNDSDQATLQQQNDSDTSSEISTQDNASEETLAIDPYRCIGCGKCTKIAPENFEMQGRSAVVISKEVSSKTNQAINICPAKAISI